MITLRHIPRQTKAGYFSIGGHTFYWSYETIIGYAHEDVRIRRYNDWGPTTGRHFKELGISDFFEHNEQDFRTIMNVELSKFPINHA